jgi:hypothetical protein
MTDLTKHIANVKKYEPNCNEAAVASIVKHLGIALRNRDSSLVSGTSESEMQRVRENWVKKKLGVTDSDEQIDQALKTVITRMKADRQKERVTVYYLLADHYKKLDMLTAPKPGAKTKVAVTDAASAINVVDAVKVEPAKAAASSDADKAAKPAAKAKAGKAKAVKVVTD